jgi:hypothetical protein
LANRAYRGVRRSNWLRLSNAQIRRPKTGLAEMPKTSLLLMWYGPIAVQVGLIVKAGDRCNMIAGFWL